MWPLENDIDSRVCLIDLSAALDWECVHYIGITLSLTANRAHRLSTKIGSNEINASEFQQCSLWSTNASLGVLETAIVDM